MLWFKNLMVYRLSRDVSLRAEEMEKQLAAYTFSPCGSQDMAKTGWVPPMGSQSDALTHASSTGQIIVCARKEEKILPTPVVKQALEAKIFKLEAEQGRKLKKTEKDSLKDEVLHSLLPRAFSRFTTGAKLGHDLEIRFEVQKLGKAGADDEVVVDESDGGHVCSCGLKTPDGAALIRPASATPAGRPGRLP